VAWLELQSQAAPHLPSRQITFPLRLLISGIQHNTLCSNHRLRILDMIITVLLRLPGERKSHHNLRVKDGLVIDMDFRMPCTNTETLSTSFGTTYSVTYNLCSPYISVPTQIQTVNPIWITCANPGGIVLFDPPSVLTSVTSLFPNSLLTILCILTKTDGLSPVITTSGSYSHSIEELYRF
jgi:hypothetical protein